MDATGHTRSGHRWIKVEGIEPPWASKGVLYVLWWPFTILLLLTWTACRVVWQALTWVVFFPFKVVGRAFGNRRRDRKVEAARHAEMMAMMNKVSDGGGS